MEAKKTHKPIYEWVGIETRPPPEYELVSILFDNNSIQPGWWTGQTWDSGKAMPDNPVVAWKRIMTHAAM